MDKNYNEVLVLSDSLGALMTLKDTFSDDPMILIKKLKKNFAHVTCMIPGHFGESGNEKADQIL